MKAPLARKELREAWPWSALGCMAVVLVYINGLGDESFWALTYLGMNGRTSFGSEGVPLLNDSLLAGTTVVYAIFGGALGLLQTLPETLRGSMPMMLHLPVTRAHLLRIKALTGAMLYLLAGGLPLLVAVLWVAVPGHYAAPFEVAMAGAVTADWLAGLTFYFAGLMFGLGAGPWYGARTAGFPAAFVILITVHIVFTFTTALIIIVGGVLVLYGGVYSQFMRKEV